MIIENHGDQHYNKNHNFFSLNGKSFEDEQENDCLKKEMALKNGIKHYIILDCRISDGNWIKQSIMNSEIPKLLNFTETEINWEECNSFANRSLIKDACFIWNNETKIIKDIAEKMDISKGTVINYLKKGNKAGLCDYVPSKTWKK